MTDELSDVYFELFESVEARNQNYIVEKIQFEKDVFDLLIPNLVSKGKRRR